MKKTTSLFLATIMFMLTAVSCTQSTTSLEENSSTSGDEPIVLNFWMGIPEENGPQAVVAAFNEEYKDKGIQVEYERYVNDESGNLKLETSLLAGGDIDVFVSYGGARTTQRVGANMAMDLTPFMEKDNYDYEGYVGANATLSYTDDVPYALYTTLTKGSLMVNADMFEEAGIEIPTEWTYSEFREVCKQLTVGEGNDKRYGMFWNTQQNASEYMSYLGQQTLGGNWMYANEEGIEAAFNNPAMVAGAQLVYDTMNVDKTAYTHADSVTQKLTQENLFLNERVAMIVGNWAIRNVKDTENFPHDFMTAYVPYPVPDEGGNEYTYGLMGDELTMNSKTEHPEEAWEFMKWYANEGVKYMAIGGRIAASNAIPQDEIMELFLNGAEDLIDSESAKRILLPVEGEILCIPTVFNSAPEITQIINEEMEGIYNNQKSIEDGLNDATNRANEILAK